MQRAAKIFISLSSRFEFSKFNIKIYGIISRLLGPAGAADPYGATTLGGLTNGTAAAAAAAAAAYGAAQPLNASALQAAAAGVAGKQIEGECKKLWHTFRQSLQIISLFLSLSLRTRWQQSVYLSSTSGIH